MLIRYKTADGKAVEVEGRLLICQDRHGKDVYQNDPVKWWERGYEHNSLTGTVEWDRAFMRWALYSSHSNTMESMRPEGIDLEIELIEDQP